MSNTDTRDTCHVIYHVCIQSFSYLSIEGDPANRIPIICSPMQYRRDAMCPQLSPIRSGPTETGLIKVHLNIIKNKNNKKIEQKDRTERERERESESVESAAVNFRILCLERFLGLLTSLSF